METELDYVKRRLGADARSNRVIAEDAAIGAPWLEKFRAGRIPNPGYLSVLHMYRYYKQRRSR